MPLIDIFVLIPLVWFTFKGFTKGIIVELSSLIALILGIYVAYFFSDVMSAFLHDNLNFTSQYLHAISFVLTFIVVIISVFFLAKVIERLIKTASLSIVNKLFGAAFGFMKIAIICGFCLFQLSCFDTKNKIISLETKKKSYTYKPLIKISLGVMPLMKNVKDKAICTFKRTDKKRTDE